MDIYELCLQMGAKKAAVVPTISLVLQPELQKYCEQNICGRYGRSYTCPPFIGDVSTLISKINSFKNAVIWQNIYPLEDSFDFEGMMDAQEKHNTMSLEIARKIYAELGRENSLVLSAGGCALCEKCGCIQDIPCRNPRDALSSLEAYGINVSKISDICELKYINGVNTVTYFAGAFYTDN